MEDKKQIFIDYVVKSIKDRVIPITSLRCLDLAEFYCNENCPIRDEEDGFCYNEDCLEFIREFGKRYRIKLKVIIEEVDSDGICDHIGRHAEHGHEAHERKKEKTVVKSCPICGGRVWWCADCLTEMEEPDPEKCTIYRELERGLATKEKFTEILHDCWYCAYLSKVYCRTGETKRIGWEEIDEEGDSE